MATAMPLDLADDNSVFLAATGLLKAERRIDVVVNNMRDPLFGALEMVILKKVEAYLNATLIGMVRLQNAFLPIMRAQNAGRIVTIAPRTKLKNRSLRGWQRAVCEAEFALAEALADELDGTGIDVEMIDVPSFEKNRKRPHSDLDKDLHQTVMPDVWDDFVRRIQNLFVKMPPADEQANHLVKALLSPPKPIKQLRRKESHGKLQILLKSFGIRRSAR
jgi:NAD(P)-dependent dehydrogenase (short-subunit alcohol dehydrogenase family)